MHILIHVHSEKREDISTSSNMAYEMTGLGPDHEYEVIGSGNTTRPPPVTGGAVLEGIYEMPANVTPSPVPNAAPTSESEDIAEEKPRGPTLAEISTIFAEISPEILKSHVKS